MKYALAIDIGASSGRHIIGWVRNGRIITEEIYRFSNGMIKKDEHLIWDVNHLFSEIINGLKKAKELNKIPETVGIDTWAVDYALLDENDNLIGDVYAYRDSRTLNVIDKLHDVIPHSKLYELTGIQYQPFNTIYQLFEDKFSHRIDTAKSFLMLPDYLNFLLTGEKRQEYTNATSTGMVNAKNRTWDAEILSTLSLDKGLFKKLSTPGTTVGNFKKEIKGMLGYDAKVVLPATHDTASAVEALEIEDEPYISSGTWSLLGIKLEEAKTDENSRLGNWSNEGGINYFRYQKNIMGMWLIQRLKEELCPKTDFITIAEIARKSQLKVHINANDQSLFAPKSMKEAFDNLLKKEDIEVKDAADYFQVAYLSLAYSYKEAIGDLEKNLSRKFSKIYIVGGGAKNKYLNKLTEDICKIQVVALPIEATAIGNLKIQLNLNKK